MTRILIVEDDIAFGTMMQTWLKKKGFDVDKATSVGAAVRLIEEKPAYNLVLSDLRLPDRDGLELLAWMHKNSMPIPFIVMTNYAEVQNAVLAMKSGAADYIAKPIQPDILLSKIKDALQNNNTSTPQHLNQTTQTTTKRQNNPTTQITPQQPLNPSTPPLDTSRGKATRPASSTATSVLSRQRLCRCSYSEPRARARSMLRVAYTSRASVLANLSWLSTAVPYPVMWQRRSSSVIRREPSREPILTSVEPLRLPMVELCFLMRWAI